MGMNTNFDEVLLFLSSSEPEPELEAARIGNALSLLKSALGEKSWVGLYLSTPTRLVLGPFQGTHACEVIAFGKGVVGTSYSQKKTIAVEDVSTFPGYICCDASAKSEICVPMIKGNRVVAILDVDLPILHEFDEKEIAAYEKIAAELTRFLQN